MKKFILSIMVAALIPAFAMAQCAPSAVTATVTLQFTGPGMLDGQFSVSASKKVNFSQGNLQYQASTNTWRFAEHQWDYIGDAAGNTTAAGSRPTQSAWIDLFGWATSGNPASNVYGYMPYYITATDINYGPGIINTEWTPENSDWGVVNAVQLGLGWHTLSNAEWGYLFNSRANATQLRTFATVHEVQGIILLPDGWTQGGSHMTATLALNNGNYTSNMVSDEDWTILEYEGAVFLPAAGQRNVVTVSNVNSTGYYWSSTSAASTSFAYSLRFGASGFQPQTSDGYRYLGFSVRLVKQAN